MCKAKADTPSFIQCGGILVKLLLHIKKKKKKLTADSVYEEHHWLNFFSETTLRSSNQVLRIKILMIFKISKGHSRNQCDNILTCRTEERQGWLSCGLDRVIKA